MTRRTKTLRTPIALAAASIVLAACSDNTADAKDDVDETQSSSSTPTEESSAPTEEPALPDGVLPLPEYDAAVDPGRYHVPLSDTLAFEVDLPEQSSANGDGLYLVSEEIVLKVEIAGEEYGVPSDPCTDPEDLVPAGRTVADLVAAIRDLPVLEVSRPEPVELDGAEGQYLETRVPSGYDSTSCTGGQVGMPGNPGTSNNVEPGYLIRWWILDVDGQRVVIAPGCGPCESGASERMTRMVTSITFTPTP